MIRIATILSGSLAPRLRHPNPLPQEGRGSQNS